MIPLVTSGGPGALCQQGGRVCRMRFSTGPAMAIGVFPFVVQRAT